MSLVKRLISRPVGWESKKDMGRRTTQASSRSCIGDGGTDGVLQCARQVCTCPEPLKLLAAHA